MISGYIFRLAKLEEKNIISSLYESVKDSIFCTWNEFYPDLDFIIDDIKNNCLYVLVDNNKIIGAASIVPINELDEESYWKEKNAKEIARICINTSHQGCGLAKEMVKEIEVILKNKGIKAIHLLAAIHNIPACKTYKALGYEVKSRVFMYDNDYYAMEKLL